MEAIIQERTAGGHFKSLYDFFKRVDTKKIGKKVAEYLIEAGSFDFTQWSRQALLESVDPMYIAAAREQKESQRGIINLFSLLEETGPALFSTPPEIKEKPSKQKILKREKELLGFYLTGHPLEDYHKLLQRLSCVSLSKIVELNAGAVCRCAFIIESIETKISAKTQKKFAILSISDGLDRFELPIWSDFYEEKHSLMVENQLVYAILQVDKPGGELKLQCKWLADLTAVDEAMIQSCDAAYDRAKMHVKMSEFREKKMNTSAAPKKEKKDEKLTIKVNAESMRLSHVLELKKLFRTFSGPTPVEISFAIKDAKIGTLFIDSQWGIQFNKQFEESIRKLSVIESINLG